MLEYSFYFEIKQGALDRLDIKILHKVIVIALEALSRRELNIKKKKIRNSKRYTRL